MSFMRHDEQGGSSMGDRDYLLPAGAQWDDFLALLAERKIPPTRHRFYVYYVERFLSVHRSRPVDRKSVV